MLTWTNTIAGTPTGGTVFSAAPAILQGGSSTPYVFPFLATGRDNTISSVGGGGTKFNQSTRTASLCYMVGLKENIQIQVANGLPWQWRRICFNYKGGQTLNGTIPSGSASFSPSIETSAGYTRPINGLNQTQQTPFFGLLFQGVSGLDWSDPFTAKVDTERISLKFDKTCTIASGNEEGVIRRYDRWHKMGHNLMYDDDESGGSMVPSFASVTSKVGMGDYWVIDMFKPRVGSATSDQLLFNCESTLYWHEK